MVLAQALQEIKQRRNGINGVCDSYWWVYAVVPLGVSNGQA
jgi:hypothetical protein